MGAKKEEKKRVWGFSSSSSDPLGCSHERSLPGHKGRDVRRAKTTIPTILCDCDYADPTL